MRKCWACSPADRPTFSQLTTMVADVSVKPLPLIKKNYLINIHNCSKSMSVSMYFLPNKCSLDEHNLTNPNILNSTTCAIDITKDVLYLNSRCILSLIYLSLMYFQAQPMEVRAVKDLIDPRKLCLQANDLVTVIDHG